ncbi:DUF2200 domain-containing protein [Actinoplanes bogorensis]|uniref:DUF2200 domain-containing protein n=1 Tax=Paractinoplanes bogorensis TaxID=1610840 RepID=A0ABS5Z324_9ACTN|nr:DUF2200 domain-containing protein [Actinoplanes bogorensis]MBU2669916.1 DUF2200 domain-containing protein [Actinoplanes bogorensis]
MKTDEKTLKRVYRMPFSAVYPHYIAKVERKGRTKTELHQVITWLTGFEDADIERHVAQETSFEDFFADARLNSHAPLITGVVCGVRVEEIEDPVMQKVRYLDKLVDELARGKAIEKIQRS